MAEKYQSVNGSWPEGTNEGRSIKPTPQEAISGARRLYRKAFGRPFKGKMKLTSGRRYTYIRNGVFYVNPDQDDWHGGGGWHEIVHGISHYASARLHPHAKGHGPQHAFIERELIRYAVENGFLEGKLRRERKPEPDKIEMRSARVRSGIKRWESKLKRAETALSKLRRQARYYERRLTAA